MESFSFMPHLHCYLGNPFLIWGMFTADLLIGLAYFGISLIIWGLVKKTEIKFSAVVLCFGIFIGACGLTHFMEVWTLWRPDYWVSLFVKFITATASIGTAVYLFRLRHSIVKVAEVAKLAEVRRLDLEALTKDLELRVEERTKEAKENEAKFKSLANSIPQLAWMTRADGYITWYNDRWCDYTGADLEQMQGWGWQHVHHPDFTEKVTEKWIKHLKSGEDWEDTFPLRGKDGQYRWFLSRARATRDEKGQIIHWFGTNTDVTEKKNADSLLSDQLALTKTITDNAASCLFMMDKSGHPTFMNPAAEELTGYKINEIKDKPLHYAVHYKKPDGSHYPMEECPIDNAQAELKPLKNQEEIFVDKAGRLYQVSYSVAPLEKNGEVIGSVLEFKDITKQKEIEGQLRKAKEEADKSHERLYSFFEQTPAPMAIMMGPDHKYFIANADFERYVSRKVVGKTVADAFTPKEAGPFLAILNEVYKTGVPYVGKALPLKLMSKEGNYEDRRLDISGSAK